MPIIEEQIELSESQPEHASAHRSDESDVFHIETVVSPEVHEQAPERSESHYKELLSKISSSSPATISHNDTVSDVKHIAAMTDEEGKIQKLLDLADTKGVTYAVKVAQSLGDYYALDRMHDELVDKLYDGLLDKGLITKE
jgi:hypothetical protein